MKTSLMRGVLWMGLAAIVALPIVLGSCGEGDNTEGDTFDRTAMLENIADNIIIPQFEELQTRVNALDEYTADFVAEPNASNLSFVQTAWLDAYRAWQYTNAFSFGPAGEEGTRRGLIEEIGTFPVSVSKIETNIGEGISDASTVSRDARGFLAIEYLLFRVDDANEQVIASFASAERKDYLTALVSKLKTQVDYATTTWKSSYRGQFVLNDGTDVGSSTSHLYNEFVRSFESIKNFKIGLPLGVRPGQTEAAPELVEAYYSGASVEMVRHHLFAIEAIWLGNAQDGPDGIGFKEYLQSVTGGPDLIAATESQLASVKAALEALPQNERLSQQVEDNTADVTTLYTELQKQTRYYKSDMSSLLGIAITFSSSDGD